MRFTRSRALHGAMSLALLFGGAASAQGQQGVLTGRVTEAGVGQPISDVQVFIIGTNVGAVTNQDGRYTIRSAPTGAQQLRAIRIGYVETKRPVMIVAGQTTTLD